MTDKELRRLSRMELIQLLLEQTRETERVQKELEEAKAALSDRKIALQKVGSIAEASLKLNGVMEAAQKAADQFLESTRAEYVRRAEAQYNDICRQLKQLEDATKENCEAMIREAKKEAASHG